MKPCSLGRGADQGPECERARQASYGTAPLAKAEAMVRRVTVVIVVVVKSIGAGCGWLGRNGAGEL